ncbi:aldehyde dehydrogenase family protein [Nitratireductor soli]|uniref:aldehyde dehydrogenase family protein n=1 Tax=Nitratireductor soli TaxID=1670619 RepID=UPI00065DEB95|nr:aldehyde dehydrogenase family protein [Nitratireductor soli]
MSSFDIVSPIDGSVFERVSYQSNEDVDSAVRAARKAQGKWANVPLAERAQICTRFVAEMLAMADDAGLELAHQMGRPLAFGGKEMNGVAERTHFMISRADAGLSSLDVSDSQAGRRVDREPLGLALVVAPWNYPFLTAINTIVPALLAGNSVILKPAGQTALTGRRFADAFRRAGLPEGVFQTIFATHDTIGKIILNGGIDFVAFTGSVRGGTEIEKVAAGRFIPITLELGGKDPAYVRSDANLERTVASLVDGSFFNSGQSCCGIERIYVAKKIFDPFVSAFITETGRTQKLGSPLDTGTTLGPVVTKRAAGEIGDQIAAAVDAGAEVVTGKIPSAEDGCYLDATTLVSVDHSQAFMTEETFGPAVGIMPVEDDEEAVRLMNDSRFGLSASLWTADRVAAEQLGRAVKTGTLFVNRCDYLDPRLAWTGIKESGRGCSLSEWGFHHVTRPKSYYFG